MTRKLGNWSASSAKFFTEDDVRGGAGGVDQRDVGVGAVRDERADHRHHRRDSAAGCEHEQRARVFGQDEVALRRRQEQDVAGFGAAHEGPGDGTHVGDGDCRILSGGGAERIGPPVADAVELDANTGPLAGKMRLPAAAGTEENGGGIGRFWNHLGDHTAQLAGGKHRIEQRQNVFWS